MKTFFAIIASIIVLCVTLFLIQAASLGSFMFWAPKYEDAKRNVYENTKSYNDGTIRDLQNMMLEYNNVSTSDAQRGALRGIIIHRAADYPEERLPLDVRSFIRALKNK